MSHELYEILRQGVTATFLLTLPVLAGATLGGILAAIIQSVTGAYDTGVAYTLRLIATVVAVYLSFKIMFDSILNLFNLALAPWG